MAPAQLAGSRRHGRRQAVPLCPTGVLDQGSLTRRPAVVVYRTDAELWAARPDTRHLTARWWRHVVARAATEVPGVAIGTQAELTNDANT